METMTPVFITIVRTGKAELTETVPGGSTPRQVFEGAGIPESTFSTWNITTESGDTISMDTPLYESTALLCGARVDGA